MNIHLMPNWPNFGLHIASTLILVLVVAKFGWAPTKAFLQKRSELVAQEFEKAQNLQDEATQLKETAQSEMESARVEARRVVEASHRQAESASLEILEKATAEAQQKIAKATSEIAQERKAVYSNIHEDIVNLAMDSAQKLLEQEINPKNHTKLFDELVAKVGGSHE